MLDTISRSICFVNQFLKSLHTDRLITFQPEAGRWNWDLPQIQAAQFTENVIDLMAAKIRKLPERTQTLLQLAACIGNEFDLNLLAIVYEQTPNITANTLWPAVQAELILPIGEHYKLDPRFGADTTASSQTWNTDAGLAISSHEVYTTYRFLHDRVQQAVYSLIPEAARQQLHYQIGRLLLEHSSPEQQEMKRFDIVNQLNYGREWLTNAAEQQQLLTLNLLAGRKAKDSVAYGSAQTYLQIAAQLLPLNCWQTHYELTFEVFKALAECEYLCGNFGNRPWNSY